VTSGRQHPGAGGSALPGPLPPVGTNALQTGVRHRLSPAWEQLALESAGILQERRAAWFGSDFPNGPKAKQT